MCLTTVALMKFFLTRNPIMNSLKFLVVLVIICLDRIIIISLNIMLLYVCFWDMILNIKGTFAYCLLVRPLSRDISFLIKLFFLLLLQITLSLLFLICHLLLSVMCPSPLLLHPPLYHMLLLILLLIMLAPLLILLLLLAPLHLFLVNLWSLLLLHLL